MLFFPPLLTSAPWVVVDTSPGESRVSTISSSELAEFSALSGPVKSLLEQGLALTRRNLPYKYGSADPEDGGMDCSGTVYFLLKEAGLSDVPRDCGGLYTWVWQQGRFQSVVSSDPATFELSRLKPGDLLFWTGTYRIQREPPVTHVMIYLGTDRARGARLMVGASEGRTFQGKPRYGVSVFDFKLPGAKGLDSPAGAATKEAGSRFIGYGSIPGLESSSPKPRNLSPGDSASKGSL